MYSLERSKIFKKDIAKVKFTNEHYAKYILYLGMLLNNQKLPVEAKDHALKGNFIGFREFHVSGDLILIYQLIDDTLFLGRIGSHSQLFE